MKTYTRVTYLLVCAAILMAVPSRTVLSSNVRLRHVNILPAVAAQEQSRASTALKQGRALLRRGNAREALGLLETALQLFTQEGNRKGQAAAHDALGDLYERQGQFAVALRHYQSARESFNASASENPSRNTIAGSSAADTAAYNANLMLAKIGDMHYRQGDIAAARSAYTSIRASKPDVSAGNTVSTARSTKEKVRGLFGRVRGIATGTPDVSTARQAASIATDAASEIRRGFTMYRQAVVYTTAQLGMGRVAFANNDLEVAKTHFGNALAASGSDLPLIGSLGQTRRFRVAARTALGDIAFRQGRYAEAVKLYTDAASGARADARLDLAWSAERGLGRSRLALAAQEQDATKKSKLREEALNAYRGAIKTIESLRAGSLRSDDARITFLATVKDVYDEAASAMAEMALTNVSSASAPLQGQALALASEAFQTVEQGRARALLDMLGEATAGITEGVPADLLKRKQENLDRQQEIAQKLIGVDLLDEEPSQSVADLEAELSRLSTEYDSIENAISVASPRYATLTAPQPATLADVQQRLLDDKTTLLEYSLGDEQSYLWAVTRQGATLHKLPPRSVIDEQAIELRKEIIPAELRRSIIGINATTQTRALALPEESTTTNLPKQSTASPARFAGVANRLYKTILEPAAASLKGKRLLVVADGALNYVPFSALVTSATDGGSNADYATLAYLVRTNETVYAPSASVLLAGKRSPAASPAGNKILLVADPVFTTNDPRARPGATSSSSRQSAEASRGLALDSALVDVTTVGATKSAATTPPTGELPLIRLTGTRMEANQISQLARSAGKQPDVWLDFDASEANIKRRDLKPYRVVHIATHGLLNATRPQFTGIVLSLVGEREDDGFLRTDEVFNLKLGSPLVMLSACETGLGKERRGEGVIGLTRAFMYAGAETVGVSLWSVADRPTAELMSDFYKRLLGANTAVSLSASASSALHQAQQNMIASKRYAAPFYWAPFVLVGSW